MELLKDGLPPFVERELKAWLGDQWEKESEQGFRDTRPRGGGVNLNDPAVLLSVLINEWRRVFDKTLGRMESSAAHMLKEFRNQWAHGESFSSDEA